MRKQGEWVFPLYPRRDGKQAGIGASSIEKAESILRIGVTMPGVLFPCKAVRNVQKTRSVSKYTVSLNSKFSVTQMREC